MIPWVSSDLWPLVRVRGGGGGRMKVDRSVCPSSCSQISSGLLVWFPWWQLTPSQCSLLCPHTSCFPPDNYRLVLSTPPPPPPPLRLCLCLPLLSLISPPPPPPFSIFFIPPLSSSESESETDFHIQGICFGILVTINSWRKEKNTYFYLSFFSSSISGTDQM